MRTLLIDNHDSFTHNLAQLLAEVNGEAPVVVRNDALAWEDIDEDDFDNVVVSPGPGHPGRERDLGLSAAAITRARLPLLGVCLGHQGLCLLHGGAVGHAPELVHGRASAVLHDGRDLFAGVPSPLEAVRYHSLAATAVPACLEVTAVTADGVVMAVRHRTRPQWGVQFHPESVATRHGRRLVENFRDLSRGTHAPPRRRRSRPALPPRRHHPPPALVVRAEKVAVRADPEVVYLDLFAPSPVSFWLDSSAVVPGRARFSFMGDATGPLAEYLTYRVDEGVVRTRTAAGEATAPGPLLDHLEAALAARRAAAPPLPFGFDLGYVGWLGYGLKAECGAARGSPSPAPDAALLFADRVVAFDHERGETWVLALAPRGGTAAADRWVAATAAAVADLAAQPRAPLVVTPPRRTLQATLRHPHRRFLDLVAAAQREIRDGESYEICLTTAVRVAHDGDLLGTHLVSRRLNPAPYAAFLRFPDAEVTSASPERFLTVGRDGTVETRPIKGTRRRGRDPAADLALAESLRRSEKDRAENLMIVDLARNDLGGVCATGSIEVPGLFEVESYATVHHLVSTVRGRLRPGISAPACVRAAFPAGSMTGAPKLRTMEILDRLEEAPRGVYSGAIGYLGLGGAADLSVVIRAVVSRGGSAEVGVGAAVTALSDPRRELAETLLKSRASLDALRRDAAPAGEVASAHPRRLVGAGGRRGRGVSR